MSSTNSLSQKEKWFEHYARFGLVSKGIVYCLIGFLTLLAALGLGGQKASKKEAFEVIYSQPFGKILLVFIIAGLLGYVVLRIFQCFKDIDNKGDDTKGIIIRFGYGISAIVYTGLGLYAGKLLLNGPGSDGDSKQFMVNRVLEHSAGQWIIAIIGGIIIGNGIRQIYKAVTGKFMDKISFIRSSATNLFKKAGILGYISRGIVLLILGYFLFHAAINSNPNAAGDTSEAFDFLENKFGGFLMGVIAFGLLGYGAFMFVKAKYQKIDIDLR